jgi:hypothetical protein
MRNKDSNSGSFTVNKIRIPKSLNNTHNILNTNLNNLHTVDLNTPEWNITPGNSSNEKIPKSLNFKPIVPKMKLPDFLQKKGGRRTAKRVTKKAARTIKRKN